MKYRKKPVIVEALLLNERGLIGEDWFWDAVTRNDIITNEFIVTGKQIGRAHV